MSDHTSSINGDPVRSGENKSDEIDERNDENFGLDIDELELPPIDQAPSLQEILNQDENVNGFDFSLEFNDVILGNGRHQANQHRDALAFDDRSDISSISASTTHTAAGSFSRKLSHRASERAKLDAKSKASKSDILRCTKLRAISNQLVSAKDRVNAGTPTAMAVCEKYIGVGTTHGLVLVFGSSDAQQVLKCCIGSASNVLESGGVAALDFNASGTKILVGFSNGWIHLYDIQTAKLVQRLSDAHPPGYSVLHLRFCTADGGTAALNDSGGSVFELTFGKMLAKSASSRCVFSGSRGEVCYIAPLIVPDVYKKQCSHYAEPVLLAMASLTKVIVVRLVPSTRVVFASPLAGRPESAPVLCWQFTQVQLSEKNRIVDPVLTFARDSTIYLYQLHTSDGEKFRAFAMLKLDLAVSSSPSNQLAPSMILHMQWLNYRYLLVLDSNENLHLFESGSGGGGGENLLETADLRHTKLIYGTSAFKALATGGNVSKALACMASKVCYHSLAVLNNQAFVLGAEAVYSISMRTWLERVDGLVQANDFPGAVRLVLDFYTGKRKLGVGLLGINNQKGGGGAGAMEKWKPIVADKGVHLVMDYVEVAMGSESPANGRIEAIQEHFKTVVPLCIESCITLERLDILFDHIYPRLTDDSTAKAVFLECLDDYIANNIMTDLPPAIVQDYFSHLEREGLYGAIEASVVRLPVTCLDLHQVMTLCRAHNLHDGIIYVFNQALRDFITPLKEMIFSLVRIISNGDLLTDEDIRLGNKVLLYINCCLCGQTYPVGNLEPNDAKRVASEICEFICKCETTEIESPWTYPFLRALLKFDCREFLNVLAMAFGSHYLDIDEQQRLIDILVNVMLDEADWAPFQTGALFTFVMRQVVMRAGDIGVARDHFRQLLKVVLRGKLESIGTCSFEERQQALIEFLHSSVSTELVDEGEVLSLAEKAQYFQVCEILYQRRRQFDKIIECMAKDAFRKDQIFDYVAEFLINPDLTNGEKASVKSAFLECVSEVGGLNVQRCADILIRFCDDSIFAICEKLSQSKSSFLVDLLKALLEIRNASGQNGFIDDPVKDQKLAQMLCTDLCKMGESDALVNVLLTNPEFRTSEILDICKSHRATKAVVYLLEQKGKLEEAFTAIYEDITDAAKSQSNGPLEMETLITLALEFLKDKCNRMPRDRQEALWFKLLVLLMNLSVEKKEKTADFKAIIVKLVHAMINFVNPSQLLPKLLDHPLFHGGTYAEFHDLIDGILNGYSYDEVLLSKLVSCVHGEIHESSTKLRGLASAGYQANAHTCSTCGHTLITETETERSPIVVFDCSHAYHSECLRQQHSFFLNRQSVQEWLCAVCNKKAHAKTHSKSPSTASVKTTIKTEKTESSQKSNNPFESSNPGAVSTSKFEVLEEIANANSGSKQWNNSRDVASNFSRPLKLAPPRL